MSASLRCPGCRRRVRVPDGTDPARCRCSKCRTRLRSVEDEAYRVFAAAVAPDPHPTPSPAEPSPAEPLSLDECEPIGTVGAPTVELPPPFKVPARVVGRSPLFGPVTAVLTPFGLFLEREPNRPLAFAPVGTKAAASGRALGLQLPTGQMLVILPSRALATDAAAFLGAMRPVPAPADYATPGWVFPSGLLLVLVLAAAAFVGGVVLYVVLRPPQNIETPSPPPPAPPPTEPPPPSPPPGPEEPPTHYDLAYRDGVTRLTDGPAAVTALAVTPDGTETVVGYADGTTWAWKLDEPAFEPPRVGPKGVGPVRRIDFDKRAEFACLTGDTGLSVASFHAPRTTVQIPGRPACAVPDDSAVRYAALRGDKLVVRYVAAGFVRSPPPARVKGGVLTVTAKDETTPGNVRQDVPAPGATFVAWHPAGKVVYGSPTGAVTAYPTGVKAVPLTRAHKAPVRAWAVGPVWPDFATGDDYGLVGVWPNKAQGPFTLQASAVAVTGLAFSPCGGELAVADESGAVAVWNLPTRAKVFETVRRPPVVVAYSPRADALLISNEKGVEVWSMAALLGGTWP